MYSLMSKVTKLILIIFGVQIIIMTVGYFGVNSYLSSKNDNILINKVNQISPFTLEEIALYELTGNETAKSILLYDLIQKKDLAEATYISNSEIKSKRKQLKATYNCKDTVCLSHDGKNIASFVPILIDNEIRGYVLQRAMQTINSNTNILKVGTIIVSLLFFGVAMNILILFLFFRNKVNKELMGIISYINNDHLSTEQENDIKEFQIISSSLAKARKQNREKNAIETTLKVEKEKNLISRQVAHDIKSPVAALETALGLLVQPNTENRETIYKIMNTATTRIQGILSGLEKQVTNNTKNEFLPTLLNTIIEEKKIEYKNSEVELIYPYEQSTDKTYAFVNKIEFHRMISNIINNAIESISGSGKVALIVTHSDNYINISITDTGKGISSDIIENIFKNGFSYKKENGTGLGLFHARETLKKWGGSIRVNSELNKGTEIILNIKRSPIVPISSDIINESSELILIADDDQNIHNIWNEKLKNIKCDIKYFHSARKLDDWLKQNSKQNYTLFIDHDFIGEDVNGLNIIDKYDIKEKSYLVTANALNPTVIRNSLDLKVKVLDKSELSSLHLS